MVFTQLIGLVLISLLFLAAFCAMVSDIGLKDSVFVIFVTLSSVTITGLGVYLITNP